MFKCLPGIVITILIISGCQVNVGHQSWYTPPNQWKQSRIYHSEFQNDFQDNIVIQKGHWPAKAMQSHESPNQAYQYFIFSPDYSVEEPWSTTIYINNEKGAPLTVTIKDHNNWGVQVKWINEKLLYVSTWWGRILGSNFIVDVEEEKIIHSEMMHDGKIIYQQYQQQK